MSNEKSLIPVEQKQVEFYGDTIIAARTQGGAIYVPICPICDLLGVDWSAQRRRITRDPVMGAESMSVAVTATNTGIG